MIVDQIRIDAFIIDKLMDSPLGEKLDAAITEIEKIQQLLAKADIKKDEKELNKAKTATIAVFAILKKIVAGKKIPDFSEADWKDIVHNISEYVLLLPDDAYSAFVFRMYESYIRCSVDIIQAFASEEACEKILKLADELRSNTEQFHNGSIDEVRYTEDCLWISLEAMFKLLSATCAPLLKGEMVSELSAALADFVFSYGRLMLYRREQEIVSAYIEAQYVLDAELEEKYKSYLADLDKQTARCCSLIEQAFSANYREAFLKSMMLAQVTGVEESQTLKNMKEIDDFFLD